jgi:hypothetical protein
MENTLASKSMLSGFTATLECSAIQSRRSKRQGGDNRKQNGKGVENDPPADTWQFNIVCCK